MSGRKRWTHLDQMVGELNKHDAREFATGGLQHDANRRCVPATGRARHAKEPEKWR